MAKAIRFTSHALVAIHHRELEMSWVERAVRYPQWIEADPRDATVTRYFLALPERGGRFLRVAAMESDDDYLIVTAFLDRRARPK